MGVVAGHDSSPEERAGASPAEATLSPQAWCRRILAALSRHKVQGPEAGYLEMLLAYFIERNPPAEEFDALLQQYCADPRPGIADAAALLLRSWQRGQAPAGTASERPPLRELLRTLGALLDESRARGAFLRVEADGALVHPFEGSVVRRSGAELQQEIAARAALRGQVQRPPAMARWEIALRAVGAALEGHRAAPPLEIVVTQHTVVVEGAALHRVYLLSAQGTVRELSTPGPSEPPASDG
jgi:hypothetical protein